MVQFLLLVHGKKYKPLIFDFSRKTNQPFFNGKWVNGLLTNFITISDRIANYGTKIDSSSLEDWERNKKVQRILKPIPRTSRIKNVT